VNAAAVTATQSVFAGGRVVNGNRLASLGVAVARDKAALSRRDALAQTEEKYWRLVGLAEKERTLRAYESLLVNLEIQASDAVAAGLATPNDELKVSLRRRQTEVDRLRLESGLRLSARDLRRHVGLPDADTIALADSTPLPPVDPSSLAVNRLGGVGRRLEIRLLERAIQAERLQTSLKIGEMLPTVSVGAQLYRYDVSGLGNDNEALVFGMVSVPITGTWKGAHEALAQRQEVRAAEIQLTDSRELVGLEIDKSWDELHATWVAVQVAEAAVEQAEVNLKEERDRYENGLVALSDLLEAQVLQHQALEQRIDARSEFWLKRSAYLRAVGVE
jgi:outer membrane protein TolC